MTLLNQLSQKPVNLYFKLIAMHSSKAKYIRDLLETENEHLKKLNEIVLQSIDQENLVMENISRPSEEKLTVGQRLADRVAKFGGSWKFIILFTVVMVGWIVINHILSPGQRFDPFPYILLNLLLSCLAAIQAPVIMMSQNRQEEKDRQRNENDYLVNLKAEIEIRTLHQKMDLLIQEQFKKLIETQAEQIKLLQAIMRDEAVRGKTQQDAKNKGENNNKQ